MNDTPLLKGIRKWLAGLIIFSVASYIWITSGYAHGETWMTVGAGGMFGAPVYDWIVGHLNLGQKNGG